MYILIIFMVQIYIQKKKEINKRINYYPVLYGKNILIVNYFNS